MLLSASVLNCFPFSVFSLLVAVPSMQKSVTSSFMGGTCLLYHYYFLSFDGKLGTGFSGVFSEVLFIWLLLVIINDRSKTYFSLSSSFKKCTSF